MRKKANLDDQTVCRHRQAGRRFEIIEKIECGLVLEGTEVKSLRERSASIEEAHARIIDEELWLIGCHIATYKFGHTRNHNPLRRRKLLAHTSQIRKLRVRVEQKGLTLIPLRIYFNRRGLAKVTLGIARSKKPADRRSDLKARDHQREIDRALQRRR